MRSLSCFYKVVFLFTLIIICTTCKKDNTPPTSLPPATQTGANTFGCKINGEVWVPYSPCESSAFPCDEMDVSVIAISGKALPIGVSLNFMRNNKGAKSGFNIGFPVSDIGNVFDSLDITYLSDNPDIAWQGLFEKITYKPGNWTITKFDTLHKIVSGTFNMTLSDGEESVVLTDGRFDFQLQDLCKCNQ